MRLIVLGTGAGGGCPQWNCGCQNCNFARNNPESARTTDSLAVAYEENGKTAWAIVNPGVDLRHQLARHGELHPRKDGPVRDTPIKAVILTDAELDHTMGLINLREGSKLKVFATKAVLDLLDTRLPIKSILKNYANLEFCRIVPGVPFFLGKTLKVESAELSRRQPKYADQSEQAVSASNTENDFSRSDKTAQSPDAVIALRFESVDNSHDGIAYAPQIGVWNEAVVKIIEGCDVLLLDGTFYTSDELRSMGVGVDAPSAEAMGHLPLKGAEGILAKLENVKARIKLLTHINNSNPILRDNSPERQAVENAGVKIAVDGMSVCSGASPAPPLSTELSTNEVRDKLCD